MTTKSRRRPQSIAELAAGVPVPPNVISAENHLRKLREQRDRIGERLHALDVAEGQTPVLQRGLIDAQRTPLLVERRKLDNEIAEARQRFTEERADYLALVERAIERRVAAAQRDIASGLVQLLRGLAELDERNAVFQRIGSADSVRKHVTREQFALVTREWLAKAIGDAAVDGAIRDATRPAPGLSVELLAAE
jgi:hypothetical protein